jgi:hypothetical protein
MFALYNQPEIHLRLLVKGNKMIKQIHLALSLLIASLLVCCAPVPADPTATAMSTPSPGPLPTMLPTQTPTLMPRIENAYYVDPTGDDANPGTATQPWRTLEKASYSLKAGDTVYVRGGVYNEVVGFQTSGTETQPIRILAYPGETPVIDGNNSMPSTWAAMLRIDGDYVEVSGFEVRNSKWMCFVVAGKNDRVSFVKVHHCEQNGILITGDFSIVEDSEVYEAASGRGSSWASALSAARSPNSAVIRRNYVHDNWGEGVSTYEANGTLIEDNHIRDNWSANLYVSDSTNILVQRNLIYTTLNSNLQSGTRAGIMLGDEKYNPPSKNITIINNIVYRTERNFYWWQGVQGGGMQNVLVANNTFVDSLEATGVQISPGPHVGVQFINNIIVQDGPLPISIMAKNVKISNNLWSKSPSVLGSGDIVADPLLAKGEFGPDWFALQSNSPAIDKGMVLDVVKQDYSEHVRGTSPDIDALEFDGALGK